MIVDPNNEISDYTLYTLGVKDLSEIDQMLDPDESENFTTENLTFTYDEWIGKTFSLVPSSSLYEDEDADGIWTDRSGDAAFMKEAVENGTTLTITGIIRETDRSSSVPGGIGYTHALTEYLIDTANDSAVVAAQKDSPDTDILTGKPFDGGEEDVGETGSAETGTPDTDSAESGTESPSLTDEQKAALSPMAEGMGMDPAQMTDAEWMQVAAAASSGMSESEAASGNVSENLSGSSDSLSVLTEMGLDPSSLSDQQLSYLQTMTPDQVREMMASYAAPTTNTYDGNLEAFGAADYDSPSTIELIPKSFADKEELTALISDYNNLCTAEGRDEDTIDYTDMVGLLMSSVTTIINAISYVLIAFVGISLVVSSIMIGIITYISVLERTKEIGILRAIGASKGDVSNVFNAETLIIGFGAGALGIIVTLLLLIPANLIIEHLTGIAGLAALPPAAAAVLVVISMLLTFISGLIPSGMAARKDPVESLRSE